MNTSTATMFSSNITSRVPTLEEMNADEIQGLTATLVFLSTICVTGIIGNSVVCHVYRTRYCLSNSQCFILCLSAMDLFSCFFVIPFEITTLLDQYTFEYTWLCKLSRFLNTFGTTSAAYLLLFIAIDRYRKVCRPFGRQISSRVAKWLCALSVILAIFVSWPAVIIYGKKTFEIAEYSLVGTECSTDDVMATTMFPFINAALFGVLFVTEIIVICILYCLIGREVRRHVNKMPKEYSIKSSSMVNMNATLVNLDNPESVTSIISQNTLNRNGNKRSLFRKSKGKRVSESDASWADKRENELSYTEESNAKDRDSRLSNKDAGDIIQEQIIENETDSNDSDIKSGHNNDDNNEMQDVEHTKSESDNEDHDTFPGSLHQGSSPNLKSDSNGKSRCGITPYERSQSFPPNVIEEQDIKKHSSIISRMSSIGSRISIAISRMTSITSWSTDAQSVQTVVKKQYLKQARARKTAFLMFLISLAFIVSYLPHLVLMLIRVLKDDFLENMNDNSRAIYRFFLRSYFLNCAINPVIYGVCDTRFRVAVKELFSKCCKK